MLVYVIGTSLSLIFAYLASCRIVLGRNQVGVKKVISWKVCAFLSFLPLMLIMAVRKNVGTDFRYYWNWFYGTRSSLEPGFILLNTFLRDLTGNPQSIFVVCAILICGCYFTMIFRESVNPAYSILLFVICKDYFIAMNGMRQYVAGGIMLFAIPFMKERKWFQSLLILMLAMLFHKSTVIFVVFYAFYLLSIKPIVVAALFALGVLFSQYIFPMLLSLMQRFAFYDNYFRNAYSNVAADINFTYITIFACFFILLSYEYKKVEKNKNLKLLYAAVIMSLLMLSLGAIMPINFHRLTWYMNAFIVLYIPEAVGSLGNKKVAALVNVLIVCFYSSITISTIMGGNQDVIPYQTMWD